MLQRVFVTCCLRCGFDAQGLWQLGNDETSSFEPKQQASELCLIILELLGVLISYEGGLEKIADLLSIATTSWEIRLIVSECQQELNELLQTETESSTLSTAESKNFMQRLGAVDNQMPTVQMLSFRCCPLEGAAHEQVLQPAEVPSSSQNAPELSGREHMRRLMARVSRKVAAGSGSVQSAIRSADVSSQNWTIADLPMETMRMEGTVLRPRDFGRGNTMLGGLVLTQMRREESTIHHCGSQFSHLTSQCSKAQQLAVAEVYNGLTPFGRDPAFNPASPLFSQRAVLSEDQFYNVSTGSSKISKQGYPSAFHPVQVQGRSKEFIVVFPMSF